ncbi:hypothetical protein Tco_1368519 [Tanacetum coccineum]
MGHSFGFAEEVDHVRILQSCNGLLLCSGSAWPVFYYVNNPSTNLFKRPLILENQVTTKWCKLEAKLVRLGFKFTLQRQGIKASAETGSATSVLIILKVQSIGMTLEIAYGLHRGRNFLESFGEPINDPILLLMELPHMLHLEGKFFESCGCLLLVCRDDIDSTEFTIYEMMKGSSVWSIRYLVNIVQLLNPLPEGWSIRTGVWSICLGEGEVDAFVVINLSGKVVKYNLISKTNTEIFDIGSNQMDDDDDDDAVLFIPPFEVDHNLYEFIPSLASFISGKEMVLEAKAGGRGGTGIRVTLIPHFRIKPPFGYNTEAISGQERRDRGLGEMGLIDPGDAVIGTFAAMKLSSQRQHKRKPMRELQEPLSRRELPQQVLKKMKAPIFVYYQLDNFYRNHHHRPDPGRRAQEISQSKFEMNRYGVEAISSSTLTYIICNTGNNISLILGSESSTELTSDFSIHYTTFLRCIGSQVPLGLFCSSLGSPYAILFVIRVVCPFLALPASMFVCLALSFLVALAFGFLLVSPVWAVPV